MKNNVVGLFSLLVACASIMPLCAAGANAQDTAVTLRVGHNNWIGYIGFYAAEKAGYFEQAGLKIEEKTFAAPGDSLVPLMNGNLDVSLTTVDSVILFLNKSPDSMKVVYMNDTSAGADAIVAAKDIKTAADLKGRKVGVTFGSCNEILLIKALQSAGLTEKDVQLVNMDPDTAGSALKAGSIDAAATWEPWISQLIGAQNANIIFSSKDAPNIIIDCTAVRKDLSPEKTAAIKKFIAIMNRGNELAIAHPEEAAKLISGKLGLPEADIVAMLKTVKLYGAEENKTLLGGGVLPAANEVVKLFKDKGVIESDLSLDNVFSPSLLP